MTCLNIIDSPFAMWWLIRLLVRTWLTQSYWRLDRLYSFSWGRLGPQWLMAVWNSSSNYLFHSWGGMVWASNQIRWRNLLESGARINAKNLLLTVAHHSRFVFPMRWLGQVLLQWCIGQILIRTRELMWILLSLVKGASLRLLHLLHVIVCLHLVSVIVVILPTSVLRSTQFWRILLVLKRWIYSYLIIKNWFILSMLNAHLFTLTCVISNLHWSLPQVRIWNDWSTFFGLKDHPLRILVSLICINSML
jgi:hypothetical protein